MTQLPQTAIPESGPRTEDDMALDFVALDLGIWERDRDGSPAFCRCLGPADGMFSIHGAGR